MYMTTTTYEYLVDGKIVALQPVNELLAVRFREPARHSTRLAAAKTAGVRHFENRLEVPNEKFTILNLSELPRSARATPLGPKADDVEQVLSQNGDVARVARVFRYKRATVVATERVLVGLKEGRDARSVASAIGGTVLSSEGNEHVIQLPEDANPLAVAKVAATIEGVEYAEPDFVNFVPKLARRSAAHPGPLDAFDAQQYAMKITRAEEAWEKVRGSAEIRIAILDEGIDTAHEDLGVSIVGAFDAADNDTFQEPNPWDGHGTACAGLAAAVHNGLGVRGVGGGCSILAVRIAYSEVPGGGWVITNSGVAKAIDWCRRSGADVLSNSWGGGAPSTSISRAFERARTHGRQGKGCVIVIAAGNDDNAVGYPANLPNVICVAASNEFDEPKTKTSHDGEHWWGSCFGPEVTLAAPGVHNYTTDITGVAGYNRGPTTPNYVPDFNGTSSATPIVAGAAALVLSANPALTEAQVRQILIETAEKIGSVTYDSRGHHPRMGFGRLNVVGAVERALGTA
jgi:thermitase